MKRKLSLLSMIAAHSIEKVFGILLALPALNALFFYLEKGAEYQPVHQLLDEDTIFGIFLLCLMPLCWVLSKALRDKGGKQENFLGRLRVSPRKVFWIHALYNTLCYGLLFAVEGLSLLGLAFWNARLFPEYTSQQTIMLECYQSTMLHIFFPLSDWLGWLTLGLLVAGLGICSASICSMNRRDKHGIAPLFMFGTVAVYGAVQLSTQGILPDGKIIVILFCIVLIPAALWGALRQEVTADA